MEAFEKRPLLNLLKVNGRLPSAEILSELRPGMVVEDGLFLKACTTRLIDTIAEITKFTDAVCICRDCDLYPGLSGDSRVFRGEIQSIGARVNLEKTAPASRLFDN